MSNKYIKASCALILLATVSCTGPDGQPVEGSGALLGGLGGAGIGAAVGGHNSLLGSLVGAGIGAVLGQMVQNLSANQAEQRQIALHQAAQGQVGASSEWSAPQSASASTGSAAAKTSGKLTKQGVAKNDKGQTCSKMLETITLPNGKIGTSEELVCPV